MDILSLNEIKPYSTNVLNTELIRTGTKTSTGSCFFYSLFLPFKHFRDMNEEDKITYIQKKRKELSEKIGMEEWFHIQEGNVAFLQIIEKMRSMIHQIPEILKNEDCQDMLKFYHINDITIDLLFTLLDPKVVECDILPEWDICISKQNDKHHLLEDMKKTWHDIYRDKIEISIEELEKKLLPEIPKMTYEKKCNVIHKLSQLSFPIFDYVSSQSLLEFKNGISDIHKWLDVFIFTSVSDFIDLDVNILIINYETGKPYEGMKLLYHEKTFDNDYPFVVLLYFKDVHFESLGKKMIIQNKTIIQRFFKKNDPFIITCLTYLENDQSMMMDELNESV